MSDDDDDDYSDVAVASPRHAGGGMFKLDYGTFYASKTFAFPSSAGVAGGEGSTGSGGAGPERRVIWAWSDETDICRPWPACERVWPRLQKDPHRRWRGLQTLPRDIQWDARKGVAPLPASSSLATHPFCIGILYCFECRSRFWFPLLPLIRFVLELCTVVSVAQGSGVREQVLTRPVPELGRLRLPRYQQRPATARIELWQDVRSTTLSLSLSRSLSLSLSDVSTGRACATRVRKPFRA